MYFLLKLVAFFAGSHRFANHLSGFLLVKLSSHTVVLLEFLAPVLMINHIIFNVSTSVKHRN